MNLRGWPQARSGTFPNIIREGQKMSDWKIFTRPSLQETQETLEIVSAAQPAQRIQDPLSRLPPPPPWRKFADDRRDQLRGRTFRPSNQAIDMVNAALYLRRPLLITGKPGTGKTSLAYAVKEQLELGRVLK